MALQGTLDTFALPDVLRLLAATKKSGRLRISGGRGTGDVWVEEGGIGEIAVSHAPHATEPVDALFELLRFEQGSFTFEADVTHEATEAAGDLETLLPAAEALLVEWREIESVVPSMDAWVTLRRLLGSSKVSIDRAHWTTVVAVGSGVTVSRMSEELCLAELHVSRAVRDLFKLGLVDIEASAPADLAPADTTPAAEQQPPTTEAEIDEPIVDPVESFDSPAEPAAESLAETDAAIATPADAGETPEEISETPAEISETSAEISEAPEEISETSAEIGSAEVSETSSASDAPLPTARPLRARRAKGGAHLAEPKEPERFVPLELPGHSFAGTYDAVDEVTEAPGISSENVDDLAAAFPGLAHRVVDSTPDEDAAAEEGEAQHASRGLLKFLSSVKS